MVSVLFNIFYQCYLVSFLDIGVASVYGHRFVPRGVFCRHLRRHDFGLFEHGMNSLLPIPCFVAAPRQVSGRFMQSLPLLPSAIEA